MKILVTGISGFIGEQAATALTKKHTVWGIYRNQKPKHLEGLPRLFLIKDDLCNPQHLPKICDCVFHAAADTPLTTNDSKKLWESNYNGTQNLLNWSIKAGVKHFLFCSTMAVYGKIQEDEINESIPPRHPDAYGASKLAAEELLQHYPEEFPTMNRLTIRLPGIVGLGAKHTFLPRTIQKILRGAPALVYKKNALFNNISHVEDLVEFALNWFGQPLSQSYFMFNAGAKNPVTLSNMAKILIECLNSRSPIIENNQGRRPILINTNQAEKQGFPIRTTTDILLKYAKEILSTQTSQFY
jgi:nucleoside-diphosphate-sugar epimerase